MARPPPAGDADPEFIEFGIPVLDGWLDESGLSFPATREEIESNLGTLEVPYDARGRTVTLAAALERLDRTEFESRQDLLDALHPVFEGYRQQATTSLVDRLRSVLPP